VESHHGGPLELVGKGSHHVAHAATSAGKHLGHGFKVFGKGVAHLFATGGHQIKDGWDSVSPGK
jgi:hypothetical protein